MNILHKVYPAVLREGCNVDWDVVSELEKLDNMMLYGGGRDEGKSWRLENNRVVFDTEFLTQPEKKCPMHKVVVQPSMLLVKLIGRIYED